MDILRESIPEKVFENEQFNMVVKLTNFGAMPVSAGDGIFLLTPEDDYVEIVQGNNPENNFDLEGKETFRNIDDFEILEYTLGVKTLDPESTVHESKIMATLCYDYITSAFVDVCIDTNAYNARPTDKVCSAEPIAISGGQGGPVGITRIEPTMLSSDDNIRPQFKIYFRNFDKGSVVQYGSISTVCSSSSPNINVYNILELSDLRFSDYGRESFDCVPTINGQSYVAKLEDEEDFIICTLNSGIPKTTPSFTTPLFVELRYGYTYSDSVGISIRKLGT